jgi:enediyne biosynthesis thioesterase
MRAFEYRFALGFQETNVVGNVYFANYFLWQGKCREDFLRQYAPQVLDDFKRGYGLITQDCACEFQNEAFAFQTILMRMQLDRLTRTGMSMLFEYWREVDGAPETLLARGRQSALWVSPQHRVALLPDYLYNAIRQFAEPAAAAAAAAAGG